MTTRKGKIINPYKGLVAFEYVFFWVRWFYRNSKGIPMVYLLYYFIPQKVFRINGNLAWPVHFTTRIIGRKNIKVGNMAAVGMGPNCYIQAKNGIEIGHNFRMGPNVGLISANHSEDDYDTWEISEPIRIGDNVWIGMGSVVLPGVSIGDNVIIAANSVVNKDIPSNVIAGGVPCKVLRDKSPYKGFDYSKL